MKIRLTSIPARGQFNPILVTTRVLKEACHETAIYTCVVFRDRMEGAGIRFIPLPEDAGQGVRDFIASFLEKHKVRLGPTLAEPEYRARVQKLARKFASYDSAKKRPKLMETLADEQSDHTALLRAAKRDIRIPQ